jgi:c-di-GMP-binding flagellar brake protein YcgR
MMTTDKTGEERRKYKRVNLNVPVEYEIFRALSQSLVTKDKAMKYEALCENISAGGIQLISDIDMQPEQILKLKILHSGEPRINAHATVRWSAFDKRLGKYRIGLEFYYLKDDCRKYIFSLTGENLN